MNICAVRLAKYSGNLFMGFSSDVFADLKAITGYCVVTFFRLGSSTCDKGEHATVKDPIVLYPRSRKSGFMLLSQQNCNEIAVKSWRNHTSGLTSPLKRHQKIICDWPVDGLSGPRFQTAVCGSPFSSL